MIIAETANPEWASVPLVGWSLSKALSQVADTHVVTQVRNRDAFLRAGWREGRDFTAIDSEAIARPLYAAGEAIRRWTGLGWTTTTAFSAAYYPYFESLLWRRFAGEIQGKRYDIVHRVTPLSPTVPSVIATRCRRAGVPFVLGPLNGGVPWPPGFRAVQRREGEWLSHLRGAHRLLPGYRSTRADAAAIIAGSRSAWEQLHQHHERCVYFVENAVDPARFGARAVLRQDGPLRVVFVGRLVPYKGADMLLDAAAPLVREGRVVLDVIGDGPELPALKRRAASLGIESGVALAGWVQHTELSRRLAESEVFAFPSIREFGGGVVLEAMEMGLVPVVVDYAGPAELVTEDTGFRVPIGNRDSIVRDFRRVLSELATRPESMRHMADAAHQHVRERYTWSVKAEQCLEVYRWVLGQRGKPAFYPPDADSSRVRAT